MQNINKKNFVTVPCRGDRRGQDKYFCHLKGFSQVLFGPKWTRTLDLGAEKQAYLTNVFFL